MTAKKAQDSPQNHYVVEKVLDHEWSADQKQDRFYVKWKDYPSSDNSWVKQEDFDDKKILKQYWQGINPRMVKSKKAKGIKNIPATMQTIKSQKHDNRKGDATQNDIPLRRSTRSRAKKL